MHVSEENHESKYCNEDVFILEGMEWHKKKWWGKQCVPSVVSYMIVLQWGFISVWMREDQDGYFNFKCTSEFKMFLENKKYKNHIFSTINIKEESALVSGWPMFLVCDFALSEIIIKQ